MPINATVTAASAAVGLMFCSAVLADAITVNVAAVESMIRLAPTAMVLLFTLSILKSL